MKLALFFFTACDDVCALKVKIQHFARSQKGTSLNLAAVLRFVFFSYFRGKVSSYGTENSLEYKVAAYELPHIPEA